MCFISVIYLNTSLLKSEIFVIIKSSRVFISNIFFGCVFIVEASGVCVLIVSRLIVR